jgi:hypothetical protein
MFDLTGKKAIVHDLVLALVHDVEEILAQEASSGAQQCMCDVVLVGLMIESCRIVIAA